MFGLSLGESTLQDAEQVFHATAEVSLFVPAAENDQRIKDQRIVEAYFDKVTLGGLSARLVAVIQVEPQLLQDFYERGARISALGSGSHKVSLHAQDRQQLLLMPIASITYLPRTKLDQDLIETRFGKAMQILVEKENQTTHWLYPDKGLDAALDGAGNAVLQYVPPSKFSVLTNPLE